VRLAYLSKPAARACLHASCAVLPTHLRGGEGTPTGVHRNACMRVCKCNVHPNKSKYTHTRMQSCKIMQSCNHARSNANAHITRHTGILPSGTSAYLRTLTSDSLRKGCVSATGSIAFVDVHKHGPETCLHRRHTDSFPASICTRPSHPGMPWPDCETRIPFCPFNAIAPLLCSLLSFDPKVLSRFALHSHQAHVALSLAA